MIYLAKNQPTKVLCHIHNTPMFSCYEQPLPTRKNSVVHLGCRDCGQKDGYKMWLVDRSYFLKYDNAKEDEITKISEDEIETIIKDLTEEEDEIIKNALAILNKFDAGIPEGFFDTTPQKRGRGRPKGSKNKPKT